MITFNDQERLREPFEAGDIEWRIGRCGESSGKTWALALAYITNRAIMDRMDKVFGCGNWRNEFKEGPAGGVLCGLSVWDDDKEEWVTKWDGAENTDIESVKGGLSDAMKRAAVQWGIGRYLYGLEEGFCETSPTKVNGWRRQPAKKGDRGYNQFWWKPPTLPAWALPKKREDDGAEAKRPEGKKYPEDQGTLVDDIIAEMMNQTDLESLMDYMGSVKATVKSLPKFAQDKITTEFHVHRGTLEMGGK